MIAWIPPVKWTERALRQDPGGGRPSIKLVQVPSNKHHWDDALVLSINDEPCALSIARAIWLLVEARGVDKMSLLDRVALIGKTFELHKNSPAFIAEILLHDIGGEIVNSDSHAQVT